MEAKNSGCPNRNPLRNCLAQWGTPGIETSQYRQEEKATATSLLTASERDTAQTEALTGDVVFGLTLITRQPSRTLLEGRTIQGDSPVSTTGNVCVSPRVSGVGIPS